MKKRRRLGQHHLLDKFFIETIVNKAEILENDAVFELGTGHGVLTEALCRRAKKVISCELDPKLYQNASLNLSRYKNLELIQGDGFNLNRRFDIFVSNLPYSESSHFIKWSIDRRFKRAVVTVQKEFAEKLLAKPGEKTYRAISIMAQAAFRIRLEQDIPSNAFYPTPRVSSKILILEPRTDRRFNKDIFLWLKKLLSFRGRRVSAALRTFVKKNNLKPTMIGKVGQGLDDRRVEDLTVEEAIRIAKNLSYLMKKRGFD